MSGGGAGAYVATQMARNSKSILRKSGRRLILLAGAMLLDAGYQGAKIVARKAAEERDDE